MNIQELAEKRKSWVEANRENKFEDGMNWDNQGEWHIDHIKPCDKFDLSKEIEIEKCFHYKNLQPLWGLDNLSKGARWSDEDEEEWNERFE